MNFFDVLGWALAAGATGGVLSMFFWLRSKALNPPEQGRGRL
ncbi:MAG TPA: hypothetical protein VM915_15305 [Verrucomicrobiae bacterium]|nr:hypothetical protein [Verrucomicrobiae bacterium]